MSEYGMEWATIEVLTEDRDELLGALREIIRQIDQGGSEGKVFARDACITRARAAIAKAEAARD